MKAHASDSEENRESSDHCPRSCTPTMNEDGLSSQKIRSPFTGSPSPTRGFWGLETGAEPNSPRSTSHRSLKARSRMLTCGRSIVFLFASSIVEKEERLDEFATCGDGNVRRLQSALEHLLHLLDERIERRGERRRRILLGELLDDHDRAAVRERGSGHLEEDDLGRQDDLLLGGVGRECSNVASRSTDDRSYDRCRKVLRCDSRICARGRDTPRPPSRGESWNGR